MVELRLKGVGEIKHMDALKTNFDSERCAVGYNVLKQGFVYLTDGHVDHQDALQDSQSLLTMMMIVTEGKDGWNAKLRVVESQCLQSLKSKPQIKIVTSEKHWRKINLHGGFPQRHIKRLNKNKHFLCSKLNRGFLIEYEVYRADVTPGL